MNVHVEASLHREKVEAELHMMNVLGAGPAVLVGLLIVVVRVAGGIASVLVTIESEEMEVGADVEVIVMLSVVGDNVIVEVVTPSLEDMAVVVSE